MLYPIDTATRDTRNIDGLWRIAIDRDHIGGGEARPGNGGDAEPRPWFIAEPPDTLEVAVPGSINEQLVDRDLFTYLNWVWYFTEFLVPSSWAEGKRIFLHFGSATHRADVYCNGESLGNHEGGFTSFEFEITGITKAGEWNQLCVRIDNLLDETTIPQGNLDPSVGGVASFRPGNFPNVHYDVYPYIGIHRPVTLYATNECRLEKLFLTTTELDDRGAGARVRLECSGGGEARGGGTDATNRPEPTAGPRPQVSAEVAIAELGFAADVTITDGVGEADLIIPGAQAWSPANPRLYDVEVSIVDGAAILDSYAIPFGFRIIEVRDEKLLLNGDSVFLRGFGKHEDVPVAGKGLSLPHLVKDFALLEWIGANSFRTSHYPYAEEVLQMADRQGVLVIDEAAANTLSMRSVTDPAAKEKLSENHKAHLREFVERDYNHPSVITWSLGNECETMHENDQGYFREKVDFARKLDNSRPIIFVINSKFDEELEADAFDFLAINQYPSWYSMYGQFERIGEELRPQIEGFREKYRKPILIAEFGADTLPGLHDEHSLMWTEEFQVEMLRRVIDIAEEYPYVIGTHVWNFSDFRVGQHVARAVLNWKGVFTRDRHPKMAAHELRRLWKGND